MIFRNVYFMLQQYFHVVYFGKLPYTKGRNFLRRAASKLINFKISSLSLNRRKTEASFWKLQCDTDLSILIHFHIRIHFYLSLKRTYMRARTHTPAKHMQACFTCTYSCAEAKARGRYNNHQTRNKSAGHAFAAFADTLSSHLTE